jgi:hypothetical protein
MDKLDYYLIKNILSYLDFRSQINFIKINKYNYNNFKNYINFNIGIIIKKKLKILKFDKYTKIRLNCYYFHYLRRISNLLLNENNDKKIKFFNKLKSSKKYTNNLVYFKYLTLYNVKSILSKYNFKITKNYNINNYIKKHFYNVYCLIDFL